jgi:benzil reductase ((S)-benzoin forming)
MKNKVRYSIFLCVVCFIIELSAICHAYNNNDHNKVALVTGASRGIGFALTQQLLKNDVDVIAVARNVESLQRLTQTYPGRLQIISADLRTKEGQLSVAPKVGKKRIHYLVHNAAIINPLGKNALLEAKPQEIQNIIEVNVIAPMILTNQLAPNLTQGSRVLLVSSRAGDKVGPGLGLYCISKTAIDRYTESLNLDLPHGILAASVHPGDIDTDMQGDLRKRDTMEFPWGNFFRSKKERLLAPDISARYLTWLLLRTTDEEFSQRKHNIYDASHHSAWANGNEVIDPFNW